MTQTEIFQNMTKGEWEVMQPQWTEKRYTKGGPFHSIVTYAIATDRGQHVTEFTKDHKLEKYASADANAVALAVNNTYGKGINPESVEKLKAFAEYVLTWNSFEDHPIGKKAKEALTAVKLG